MAELSITEEVQIQASLPRVWRALTTAEELVAWYAPGCRWEIEGLAPGAAVRFYNTETDIQTAVVEETAPPHRLVLRWRVDAEYPAASIVNTFTLAAAEAATTVTIRQAGYETLPAAACGPSMEQDRGALAAIAASLKDYLETGAAPGPLSAS